METPKIDIVSYELGMINCFVEMVACGVKRLALSPPVPPENYQEIAVLSEKMVKGFGIHSYLDKCLMITDIQSAEFTRGKWSILYYDDPAVLEEYLELKERKKRLEEEGKYGDEDRRAISEAFGRLLSYPEEKIQQKLSNSEPPTPFSLV